MPSVVRQEISIPGTSATPCSRAPDGGLGPAVGGVVIGQGDDVETRLRRRGHHRAGRLGAVGNIRVGMQVDPHLTSLVDRRGRAPGYTHERPGLLA